MTMNTKATLLPDRTVVEVAGDDRVSFLQGLVTNDVAGLGEGEARFAGLLSPQGKILFDFFIIPHGETLLLDCASAISADLAKRLAMYRLRAKVTISDVSDRLQIGAAWGDGAEEWAKANAAVAYPDPRLPALGWRLLSAPVKVPALRHLPATMTRCASRSPSLRAARTTPMATPSRTRPASTPSRREFHEGLLCWAGSGVAHAAQGNRAHACAGRAANQPLPQGGADILAGGFAVGRLGSIAGGHGIAMARLDRVRDAIAKGHAFTAEDIPVHLAAPAWAAYSLDAEPAGAAP